MSVTRISFVCMGNICRSPLAEGVFKDMVRQAGVEDAFEIESAGIGRWHVGEAPDRRALQTARAHGLKLTSRAQQFLARDFARFDVVVALDSEVAAALRRLAPNQVERDKVRLLRETDPAAGHDLDVPDPYYGGDKGFEEVYRMIERSSRVLLEELRAQAEARQAKR